MHLSPFLLRTKSFLSHFSWSLQCKHGQAPRPTLPGDPFPEGINYISGLVLKTLGEVPILPIFRFSTYMLNCTGILCTDTVNLSVSSFTGYKAWGPLSSCGGGVRGLGSSLPGSSGANRAQKILVLTVSCLSISVCVLAQRLRKFILSCF